MDQWMRSITRKLDSVPIGIREDIEVLGAKSLMSKPKELMPMMMSWQATPNKSKNWLNKCLEGNTEAARAFPRSPILFYCQPISSGASSDGVDRPSRSAPFRPNVEGNAFSLKRSSREFSNNLCRAMALIVNSGLTAFLWPGRCATTSKALREKRLPGLFSEPERTALAIGSHFRSDCQTMRSLRSSYTSDLTNPLRWTKPNLSVRSLPSTLVTLLGRGRWRNAWIR